MRTSSLLHNESQGSQGSILLQMSKSNRTYGNENRAGTHTTLENTHPYIRTYPRTAASLFRVPFFFRGSFLSSSPPPAQSSRPVRHPLPRVGRAEASPRRAHGASARRCPAGHGSLPMGGSFNDPNYGHGGIGFSARKSVLGKGDLLVLTTKEPSEVTFRSLPMKCSRGW